MAAGRLILSRHGESQFDAKSLWTGQWDIPLTTKGRHEAVLMGKAIADTVPDVAYTSSLIRAQDTLQIILQTNGWKIPVHQTRHLNERDYGELTGLNKWEVEEKYGEARFTRWRRGWNEPVPGGETLKDVYARATAYFDTDIRPSVEEGHTVLMTAHGNTLRALVKYLDDLSDLAVEDLGIPFGQLLIYEFDKNGQVVSKIIRQINITPPPGLAI